MVDRTHICETLDGNPHAPILNVDDDERNLNANDWGNDWDDRHRFPVVRNFIPFSRAPRGSFLFPSARGLDCATRRAFALFQKVFQKVP